MGMGSIAVAATALTALAGAAMAAPVATTSEPADAAPAPAPASTGPLITTLIGAGAPAISTHAAVIRLGPPEAFVTDDSLPILFDALGRAGRGLATDSLTCLTQAIYYEARSESQEGQQAVAQVVMNRARSGRYPASVCGVVYQGAERVTGCQFTFVCDGSLRPPRDYGAWERARSVAQQALGGFVYKPLERATHYHASWMTPYWSAHLTRLRQIGGHVFYQ